MSLMKCGLCKLPLKIILMASLFVLTTALSFGNPDDRTGTIRGHVTTSDGQPAVSVSVILRSTGKGVTTNERGQFEFNKLKAGSYTLQISLLGYENAEQTFIVEQHKTTHAAFQLKISGNELQQVVVNAARNPDSKVTKADSSAASKATIGQKVPGYATNTANAWVNYQVKAGALKGLGLSAGLTYLQDRHVWEWSATAPQLALPDYVKFDGGIFWEQSALRLTLNVFNLADKFLYSGAAYGDYYYWQAEAGRNWRLGVAYKF